MEERLLCIDFSQVDILNDYIQIADSPTDPLGGGEGKHSSRDALHFNCLFFHLQMCYF